MSFIYKNATVSSGRAYRYSLSRIWDKEMKYVTFHSAPFSIKSFINDLSMKFDSLVLCSATLTINGEFDYFINELGLDQYVHEKMIKMKSYSSNFYREDQTKLFILNTNLEINSYEYYLDIFKIQPIHLCNF